MSRLAAARGVIGVAVLLGASLAAPSAPPAVAVATPGPRTVAARAEAAPVLLEVDARALTTPAAGEDMGAHSGTPSGVVIPARAGSTPAAPAPSPAGTDEARARFRAALAVSAWPRELWPLVEARVACESGFGTTETAAEGNGSTSAGLLMVNSVHRDLVAAYDLDDPLDNLNAAWVVARRHVEAGLPTPWQHCDAIIAARGGVGR